MKQKYFKPQTDLVLTLRAQEMLCASDAGASINDLVLEDNLDGDSLFE